MATILNSRRQMKRLALIMAMVTAMLLTAHDRAITAQGSGQGVPVQDMPPVASFRSGIDLVRISAVVRDRKGRFVRDLTKGDFHVLDDGQMRPITDFRHDVVGISITLLFDVSGSMEARLANAREAASHLLSWIDKDKDKDEAAVFTFDTRLVQLTPFTRGMQTLPSELDLMTPFGATGLHDAVAQTAQRLEGREGRRRAVVVLTDGKDNASRLTAPSYHILHHLRAQLSVY